MEKIALITDSAADLPVEYIKENNIKILPLRIIYKDREYRDRVDITPQEVYDRLEIEIPKTSLPSMADIHGAFQSAIDEGCTHAIVLTISSGLSGTYNAIKLASEDYKDIKIHVFDSKALSIGCGGILMECKKLIDQGNTFDEVIEKLPKIKNATKIYYIINTLEYLIKGGRIGRVAGTIGELLNIKPIISTNDDGVYYTVEKARGRKQSINRLVSIATETLKTSKAHIWIMHGSALDEAKEVFERFKGASNVLSLNFSDISPVAAAYTGAGLIGIGIIKEPKYD